LVYTTLTQGKVTLTWSRIRRRTQPLQLLDALSIDNRRTAYADESLRCQARFERATAAEGRYQLQYNSDLSSSNWTNLDSPVTAAEATLNATNSTTTSPQRFDRLRLLP
jgi:hypothetical protein